MRAEAKFLGVSCMIVGAVAATASYAQDASSSGSGDAAPVIKPYPADPAPLAAQSMVMAVARAGDHLIAVGAHGDIISSTDAVHWTQMPSPVRDMLTAVTFTDANNGWAVGHDASILHTTDGGKTWKLQNFDPKLQSPFLNIYMGDAQHGFAIGAFGLFKTTADGGATWTDVKSGPIGADQFHLYDLIKLGDGTLLIAAEQGTLYASTDQGQTWDRVKSPYAGSFFGAVPAGPKGALIFGLRGHAYLSDDVAADIVQPDAAKQDKAAGSGNADADADAGDGGASKPTGGNWKAIDTGTIASFFAGTGLGDGRFVLAGSSGTALLVSADGSSVKKLPSPSDQDYDAVMPYNKGLILTGVTGVHQIKSLP